MRTTGKVGVGTALLLALMTSPTVRAADCAAPLVQQGEARFASECAVCHSAKADGPTMMGPNLHGLYGRTSGSLAGFSYSQAMKTRAVEWQMDSLQQFIAQPQAFVPGTYMPYVGLASADDRHAVACFLGTQK